MFSSIRTLSWKEIGQLWLETVKEFFAEKGFFHGAALSYYTVFAMVPIIYLSIISFGRIIGQAAILQIIEKFMREQVGIQEVDEIIGVLNKVNFEKGSFVLNIVGIVSLLLTSTALFASLRNSINEFYDLDEVRLKRKKKVVKNIVSRLVSIGMLMAFGLVVVVAYFLQIFLLSFGSKLLSDADSLLWLLKFLIQYGISLGSNVLLFGLIFKYLHDGKVAWKLAFAGSAVTALLFYLGQILIKFYLQNYFFGANGGAIGSILIILAFVFYTSQIIFFGAKFTAVYARKVGKPIQPDWK